MSCGRAVGDVEGPEEGEFVELVGSCVPNEGLSDGSLVAADGLVLGEVEGVTVGWVV